MSSDIKNQKIKVAIVSYPSPSQVPYGFLSDLSVILDPITDRILIIDGNTNRISPFSEKTTLIDIGVSVHFLRDVKPAFCSAILWLIKSVIAQLKTSIELIKLRNSVDTVLFYAASPHHLLPLVTAKILKKRAVEVINVEKAVTPIGKIFQMQNPLIFRLLDGISPLTETIIRVYGLDKYAHKLLPDGFRFIDTSRFKVTKQLTERKNVIGFISRFTKEKGIVEFVKAIPTIAQQNKDTDFLIGGSGDLMGWVEEECTKIKDRFGTKIVTTGWIGRDLPDYLNQLKLLVLPTRTEALGTALLEAMACGTPVLAPATGGIVDIVKDGETGFLLPNVEPECIAKSVTQILARPDAEMSKVIENGIALVNERYSYAAAVERYREILKA